MYFDSTGVATALVSNSPTCSRGVANNAGPLAELEYNLVVVVVVVIIIIIVPHQII